MPETFEPLGEPFSTADAEAPDLAYKHGVLHVRFRDWREREVELMFRDVITFSWDKADAALSPAHRDDTSFIVIGSEWLRRHIEARTIPAEGEYRHFRLCFNAAGVLQVISTGLEIVA